MKIQIILFDDGEKPIAIRQAVGFPEAKDELEAVERQYADYLIELQK